MWLNLMEVSKTQIDRLGDRMRRGKIVEADLRLLDQYRRSYTEAYEDVVAVVRGVVGLEPTGRPAKSTTSIADKLRREHIRLSQIQDIAGCRLIVENIEDQNRVVESLGKLFERVNIIDRRERPSHGYRAVHLVVTRDGKVVEIQVRTKLQHLWAELSEKLSDLDDPAVKYGGGHQLVQGILTKASAMVAQVETLELESLDLQVKMSNLDNVPADMRLKVNDFRAQVDNFRAQVDALQEKTFNSLREAISSLEGIEKEINDDISN